MSAEILEKASELAEAIAGCKELTDMKDAEMAMHNDSEAVKIIGEFQQKQQVAFNAQMGGGEISDQEKKEIEAIESKMENNPAIKAYMDASDRFENLLKSVNMIITRAISGEESSCGCGGGDCGPECGPSCGCN